MVQINKEMADSMVEARIFLSALPKPWWAGWMMGFKKFARKIL